MISYEPIIHTLKNEPSYRLDMLRLDLIDKEISGNKWFKLKKNLEKAISGNFETVITFGGAFSNHIAATAAACKKYNLKCIGVIRGEDNEISNPTLKLARENGMHLHFVSREMYSQKDEIHFKKYLENNFGNHYLIPEGGNNEEGILGCMEILKPGWNYDYVFCACGTATTYVGIVAGKKEDQIIIGISVLKGENKLPEDVEQILQEIFKDKKIKIKGNEELENQVFQNDCIINSYSFKGYAKLNEELISFKQKFESEYGILLDHVYTTKLMYAVTDLMEKNKLKHGAKILAIHSGGLQGNKGFEERYHLMPHL